MNTIDTQQFRNMFLCGADNLSSNKAWINELNVFPVPDGDTGTNMTMTVMSAVHEVANLGSTDDMHAICKAISSGSLRGARGNSGVILSQLFRGFCKIVRDRSEIDVPLCAAGMDKAVETAYKAVMKPKEGTILTVARGAAEKARELADQGVTDFDDFLPAVLSHAGEVLASTPDLLPVLKQAGVVDSGGQGLVQVLKGAYEGYQGKTADLARMLNPAANEDETDEGAGEDELRKLKYGYCLNFFVDLEGQFNPKTEADVRKYMETIGDHLVCVRTDNTLHVQVYTNDPGLVLQKVLMYGQLRGIQIANLRLGEEHEELAEAAQPADSSAGESEGSADGTSAPSEGHKEMAIIAVAAGEGLSGIFRGLGVDHVISGGQTMNPSTEDILNAVDETDADTIFVRPNNKNIIMAANQAAALSDQKKVIVIPTKNVPQGITATINFMPDLDPDVNEKTMEEEISRVKSAEVTYAVRDTIIDDVTIHAGNMMAIGDSGILYVGEDRNATALEALKKMVDDTTELVSIYYGADTTEEDANALLGQAKAAFPNCDVELQNGGQPVYYYMLSAE